MLGRSPGLSERPDGPWVLGQPRLMSGSRANFGLSDPRPDGADADTETVNVFHMELKFWKSHCEHNGE